MEKQYKIGGCYRLNPKYYYYSVTLEEGIKFKDPVAVIITKIKDGDPRVGRLVRIKKGTFNTDDITTHEIMISSYQLDEEYEINPERKTSFEFMKKFF